MDLIKKLYEKTDIKEREILESNLQSSVYDNEYQAITAWYLHIRRQLSTHPLFRNQYAFKLNEQSHILEQLVILDEYKIEQIIMALNFLATDSYWRGIPSFFSFKTFRNVPKKEDKTSFDKIYAFFEKKNSFVIDKIFNEEKAQANIMKKYM